MMTNNEFKTIRLESEDAILTIFLNRPDVHNAFNEVMLEELESILENVNDDNSVRVVMITGLGQSFSAGADLTWMKQMVNYDYEENLANARLIARVFHRMYTLRQPVIAAINGAVIGGGMGFVGAADIVVSSDQARFAFSEVRLGIIPACISTFLLRKTGEGVLKELFLTGRRFTADEAQRKQLVNHVVPHDQLLQFTREIAVKLLRCGPRALASCKELFQNIPEMPIAEANEYAARFLARLRTTEEAQEGMGAFLEKRKPAWYPGNQTK
jgi:methylglutaconyl-CoA hydratase